MHKRTEDLTVTMDTPDIKAHGEGGWGGMVVGYVALPGGADFGPSFEGLPNDACHCPHWGYVIKGAMHLRYTDGTVEITKAGEAFYWPSGHTVWVEEDTIFLDFSPEKEHGEVMAHIASKMG